MNDSILDGLLQTKEQLDKSFPDGGVKAAVAGPAVCLRLAKEISASMRDVSVTHDNGLRLSIGRLGAIIPLKVFPYDDMDPTEHFLFFEKESDALDFIEECKRLNNSHGISWKSVIYAWSCGAIRIPLTTEDRARDRRHHIAPDRKKLS